MKTITLCTVVCMMLGIATIQSSVGGPLTELFILILAMWAAAFHEIWSRRLGLLGAIASIVLSFIGGALGIAAGNIAMEMILSFTHIEGSLAKSNHPLLYVLSAAMASLTVLGSWAAIQIVVWFKTRRWNGMRCTS